MTALASLPPAEAAAVFLTLLGDEEAAGLLAHLSPRELEIVGTAMCELGEIEDGKIADAIAGFVSEAEREGLPVEDPQVRVSALMRRAVGEVKGSNLMERIVPDDPPRSIEIARWLAPGVILALIEEEHPQVVAVLLLLLDPEVSAQILAALTPELQSQVVERIAKISEVPPDTLDMLDQLLCARIESRHGGKAMKAGGPRDAANLINLIDPAAGRDILPSIEQRNAALANAIEEELFTFEMLFELDAKDMGRLLRDVENEHLITALKGLPEEEQQPFFAAMSSRAADGVRDEMELLPKLKKSDVLDAQKAIIEIARKLSDDGEISLGASDGDFI